MIGLPHLRVTAFGAKMAGRDLPCAVGRGGIGLSKREGDGVTPAGVHKIVGLLYRPDRIAKVDLPDWALPIGVNDIWSDDPTDPDYNLLCRAPHPFGHEKLRRSDPLYDMILLTNYNWPYAKAGAGSAIFLHVWRKARHPTAGCVAFAKSDLMWVAQRLRPASRVIIQL
jgi:L,D-peptidoglycan transpeptidase YkuD (ErfK/YbiS/YcfS/YnhG family)